MTDLTTAELLGKNIAERRKKLGFSQKYLSVKLGISQESMARIEKGIIAPKVSRLEDIARTLNCTISFASARRIAELLEEKTDIKNPQNPEMSVKDGSICFQNVDFVYASKADKKVLSNINLSISSGETIGIIGATGSSKSSLVQLIPRLYDVSGGRLLLGGVDVREYDLDTLRNSVAMVLQKNELFSGTIKENLRWGNENASDEEIEYACKLACAAEKAKGVNSRRFHQCSRYKNGCLYTEGAVRIYS